MTPTNDRLEKAVKLGFSASNNEAEYEKAVEHCLLRMAREFKLDDSFPRISINHHNGDFQARDARMARYLALTERNYEENGGSLPTPPSRE